MTTSVSISMDLKRPPSPEGSDRNSSLSSTNESSNSPKKQKQSSTLSQAEKKLRHIQSEHKRREQIRSTFDKLVHVIPNLEEKESRSELVVLHKTSDYILSLRERNEKLKQIAKSKGIEIPEELLK